MLTGSDLTGCDSLYVEMSKFLPQQTTKTKHFLYTKEEIRMHAMHEIRMKIIASLHFPFLHFFKEWCTNYNIFLINANTSGQNFTGDFYLIICTIVMNEEQELLCSLEMKPSLNTPLSWWTLPPPIFLLTVFKVLSQPHLSPSQKLQPIRMENKVNISYLLLWEEY